MKVGLCQMKIKKDKRKNLLRAEKMINEASKLGADIIVLPEMFNCPYDNSYFEEYSEIEGESETLKLISNIAKSIKKYIIAGSIPENDNGHIYNTSYAFNKKGDIIDKHRKIHLFDIDVENGVTFKESDVLSRGDSYTVFDTEYCKIGLQICYDIRFPELSRLMVKDGADIIITPASFNMTTGPAHWKDLFKVRALDNQVYTIGCSGALNEEASYNSYGHSIIVSPWGDIINNLEFEEDILIEEIDLNRINDIREQLPLLKHRRLDLYDVINKKD
ncbi:carbon-nitrogen hydrolase family protein [Clostridium sp. D2Q-14]|uniref:carbon-nitrogen hydrolase family protein n=1 Tax=Anaeromonas gelatinilytica TaxID=2683194 RepID=UPI00193BBDC7|nr:carbon-nitrogen hydrolase family protein [Anaeromonas gelatinilytica]MBS4534299.1 carbon-nitrogen hydrolase family protein [Anaeromonas gelatinilytica]